MRNIRKSTKTFTFYNRNPRGLVGSADCVARAISTATGKTWEDTIRELTNYGIERAGVFNEKNIYAGWLESNGWKKQKQPRKSNGKKYTVLEFQQANPKGMYIVSLSGHLTVVEDGIIYDTWNCQNSTVGNYWSKT
ncbi:MAG: hypothetical protein RG740_06770 [Acholeplasmataceae bacterium]|nr:hypothetical protein [Acholeplasmataceae bacterium]